MCQFFFWTSPSKSFLPKKHTLHALKRRNKQPEKKMECHWGLSRWFLGIKEYIVDRCLCCGTTMDANDQARAFSNTEKTETTDCSELSETASCYNNPVSASLCCPILTVAHLYYLPLMCCYQTRRQWDDSTDNRFSSPRPVFTPIRPSYLIMPNREYEWGPRMIYVG